jgi:hypothetical protein
MSTMLWIAAAYIVIGFLLTVFGPLRRSLEAKIQDMTANNPDVPHWKATVLRYVVLSGVVFLWAFFLPAFLRSEKPKTYWDALQENPAFRDQKELFEAMSKLCEDGVDADELPNGQGEFGMVPSNPIPCKTIAGSTSYLARLRTPDGTKVVYERAGSVASEVSPHPVDAYEISHPNGQKLATLFISPYQKRISGKPPGGFTLADIFEREPTADFRSEVKIAETMSDAVYQIVYSQFEMADVNPREIGRDALEFTSGYIAGFSDVMAQASGTKGGDSLSMTICIQTMEHLYGSKVGEALFKAAFNSMGARSPLCSRAMTAGGEDANHFVRKGWTGQLADFLMKHAGKK